MKKLLKEMSWGVSLSLALFCVVNFVHVDAVGSLHRMNVKKELVTVSGFSSGGTMAQHMFVSYSSKFSGVATISHAYYRCGPGVISNLTENNFDLYDAACTSIFNPPLSQLYDPANAVADILDYYKLGLIDDPKNMKDKPLYIYAGLNSVLFPMQIGVGAVQVFEPFIKNRDKIKVVVQTANLTLPVDRPGFPSCSGPPNSIWISDCGFSAALESLQWILGKKHVRTPSKTIRLQMQPLLEFDQTEFLFGFGENVINGDPFMDNTGFYYIPKACRKYGHKCLLHFYFHGCLTGRDTVGPDHILNSGFLEVAEANGIIMVFPQTVRDPKGEAAGCWDAFAYTGDFYATQIGSQVIVVKNMLDRILGPDEPSSSPAYSYSYTEPETTPVSKPYKKSVVVSPELLRTYDDDKEDKGKDSSQYQETVDKKGRVCNLVRISPDTVLKRCRAKE